MIQLLYTVIFAEAAMIMLLLFKSPLRKLVIAALDKIKRGRGPIVIKTVSGTISVVLFSTIYSTFKIQRRSIGEEGDTLNPTDQVLFSKHLLEASLMGFILFLALMIDRLHHYLRELRLRRKTMEAVKRTEVKCAGPEEVKAREEQVDTFKAMIKQLESELDSKVKEATTSEATVEALRKQCEGLLLEYDRLLAENQELRNQLQRLDQKISYSAGKKDS
ncbi:B-cell receptor-associated protein 31 [Bienertia sinuspersici]